MTKQRIPSYGLAALLFAGLLFGAGSAEAQGGARSGSIGAEGSTLCIGAGQRTVGAAHAHAQRAGIKHHGIGFRAQLEVNFGIVCIGAGHGPRAARREGAIRGDLHAHQGWR